MSTYKIKYLTTLNYWRGKRYQSTNIIAPDPATAELEAVRILEGGSTSLSKTIYDVQVWLNGRKVTAGC